MNTISKQQLWTVALLMALLVALGIFVIFTAVDSAAVVFGGGSSTMGQCLISLSGCTGA